MVENLIVPKMYTITVHIKKYLIHVATISFLLIYRPETFLKLKQGYPLKFK